MSGQILKENVQHQGGRPKKQSHVGTVLPEGVNKSKSSRCQQVAFMSDGLFSGRHTVRAPGLNSIH